MLKIKLPHGEWYYDPNELLGPEGGFGVVFAGAAQSYEPLAVKKIKLTAEDAAHRELRIADELAGKQFAHIVPILDSGQDAESGGYFVVMSRAEKSLQGEINAGRSFTKTEVAEIMLQIAQGLSEVPEIVHRDLKPGNVLYHDNKWKIADFGIARFVEESTSLRTLKDCLSPQYAAPEQWRFERSTHMTDVYALGCIGYALLTGQPPFDGPRSEDFRQQHLYNDPPRLTTHDPRLQSLLSMMLRKPQESRPSIDRVNHLLSAIITEHHKGPAGIGLDALARVGADLAKRTAEEEAKRTFEREKQAQRDQLVFTARNILKEVGETLFQKIMNAVPTANLMRGADQLGYLDLGRATLAMSFPDVVSAIPEAAFRHSGWDVITDAFIFVHQNQPEYHRSALLLYADQGSRDQIYRWYEVSYFEPLSSPASNVPFALKEIAEADEGIAGGGRYQLASKPRPIDDESIEDFCERWAVILAKACKGQLEYPRYLPLD